MDLIKSEWRVLLIACSLVRAATVVMVYVGVGLAWDFLTR